MVHPLTHKAIVAYVLNTGQDKVPENPTFNENQAKKLETLETAVDQCANDAFVELSKSHSFTLKVNKYPFFSKEVFAITTGFKFVKKELEERGIKLTEDSDKVRYGAFQGQEFVLTPAPSEKELKEEGKVMEVK